MIVIDTDVLIDALRGREPAKSRVTVEIQSGQGATTSVNAFELLSGARSDRERTIVDALLGGLTVLPLDEAAARVAAEVRLQLEANGNGIGMADYLIAGICRAQSAMLLTRNRAHFERVPDLALSGLGSPAVARPVLSMNRAAFLDWAAALLCRRLGVGSVRREENNVQHGFQDDVHIGIVATTQRTDTHDGPCIRVHLWTKDANRVARWVAGATIASPLPTSGLALVTRPGSNIQYLELAWANDDLNGFQQWLDRVEDCVGFFVGARDADQIP